MFYSAPLPRERMGRYRADHAPDSSKPSELPPTAGSGERRGERLCPPSPALELLRDPRPWGSAGGTTRVLLSKGTKDGTLSRMWLWVVACPPLPEHHCSPGRKGQCSTGKESFQ